MRVPRPWSFPTSGLAPPDVSLGSPPPGIRRLWYHLAHNSLLLEGACFRSQPALQTTVWNCYEMRASSIGGTRFSMPPISSTSTLKVKRGLICSVDGWCSKLDMAIGHNGHGLPPATASLRSSPRGNRSAATASEQGGPLTCQILIKSKIVTADGGQQMRVMPPCLQPSSTSSFGMASHER